MVPPESKILGGKEQRTQSPSDQNEQERNGRGSLIADVLDLIMKYEHFFSSRRPIEDHGQDIPETGTKASGFILVD